MKRIDTQAVHAELNEQRYGASAPAPPSCDTCKHWHKATCTYGAGCEHCLDGSLTRWEAKQ